jgi:hypothetical protein
VPVEVENVILKLIEKEPDRRYQTAHDVVTELRTLIGEGPAAPADPALQEPPSAAAAAKSKAAPPGGAQHDSRSSIEADAREALARTFGKSSKAVDAGYAETLAGMLATRKRDYPEAARAYRAAMTVFGDANNDHERAKTALKYATMVMQKITEAEAAGTPIDRRELADAVDVLTDAIPAFRGRGMLKELEEAERLLYALQRTLIRIR